MKKFLSFLILVATSFGVRAQWNNDPSINNLVTDPAFTATKTANVAVTDTKGGMYLAWIDSRVSSGQSIYLQRILSDGSLKFANEILVSDASGSTSSSKSNLTMDVDSAGGVILAWQDSRNFAVGNSNNEIFGQRVDSTGAILWAANGIRLTISDNSVSSKIVPHIATVNKTEAIIVFTDNRVSSYDIYAQKILIATGVPQWASDVSIHGDQPNTQTSYSLQPDNNGGAFVVWQDPRISTTNSDIYAQRINNSGALLWGASGTAVCTAANNQLAPQFILDGAGGIVVTWGDNRVASADGDIYAQRLNSNGIAQWTADGVAVCIQAGSNQSNPAIVAGGAGYIFTWADNRAAVNNRNLYVNSLDNNGATQWTTAAAGGLVVCTATGHQPASSTQSGLQLISDGSNGAVLIWDDGRGGSAYDIYAQRVNSSGATQWTPDGVIISSADGAQQTPVVVMDELDNVIIAWKDGRNGTPNSELYASKLLLAGVLPVTDLNVEATVSGKNIAIKWSSINELNTRNFDIQKSKDGINFKIVGSISAKNGTNNSYNFIDENPFGGDNYYRIQSIDIDGHNQYSKIVKVNFALSKVNLNIYPNPAINKVRLEFTTPTQGQYDVEVLDTRGVNVLKTTLQFQQSQTIELDLSHLSRGIYFVKLISMDRKIVATTKVQKL
ncbi:MAG: T9SS type A sorting domain-containing protein [Ferruginibacter sp.]